MLFDVLKGGRIGSPNTIVYVFNMYHEITSFIRCMENTKLTYFKNIQSNTEEANSRQLEFIDYQLKSLCWNLGRCISAIVKLPGNEFLQAEAKGLNTRDKEGPFESFNDTRVDSKLHFINKAIRFMLGNMESQLILSEELLNDIEATVDSYFSNNQF